ncbi:MAG: pepsin/retropepsin-like aspartic protease family protein [Rhizomicrobium sp.]
MSSKLTSAALLAASCLLAGPAFADCKPLSIVASVDLAPTADIRPFVPVTFGDTRKTMLVDTGGTLTEMLPSVADALGLKPGHGADAHSVRWRTYEAANIVHDAPTVLVHASMKLGNLVARNMEFRVTSDDDLPADDATVAGLIAPDVLGNYDVEMDFGARKLNLLSQDHCEGKVVYWNADAVAIVPFEKMPTGHIQFPVQLDGKAVVADLDTGARATTLTRGVASRDFSVEVGDAATPAAGNPPQYRHVFKTLDIGGVVIANPGLLIVPDVTRNMRAKAGAPPLGTRLSDKRIDETDQALRIGMDILRHLHVYIAYAEKKIYITAGSPSPAPANAPHPAS